MRARIHTEFINGASTVQFERTLHEVGTADGMNLVVTHKRPVSGEVRGAVLFIHGLGQNRYSWTLTRRSMENYFVSKGLETFNAELRGHGLSRANGSEYPTGFETYLQFDVPAILEAVHEISGGRKVFLVGHSLGGTIAYCLPPQLQDYLAGIISIGGPFRMGKGNPLLRVGAKVGVTAGNLVRLHRLHPKAFYVDVIGLLVRYGLFFFDNPFNRIPVQVWFPRSIERDILVERIEKGFDRTSFAVFWLLIEWAASGRLHGSDGTRGFEDRISALTVPILFVVGDRDYVVPETSVREAYEKAGSSDKELKVFGNEARGLHWGHCDLICGEHAPRITWPYMWRWIEARLPDSPDSSQQDPDA